MTDTARPTSLTLVLADKTFTVQRFTIGQLRDLYIGVALPDSEDPQERQRRNFNRNLEIILAALKKVLPNLSIADLEDWMIDPKEMTAAADAILHFSGLITKSASPPLAAAAAAIPTAASTGGASSAGSPPV